MCFACSNEMYGFEKSFLEAEYHCQNGYKLIKKSPKRKSMTIAASSGKNLICKKRRWLGQKPYCRQIKNPSSASETEASTVQQCDSHEAQKCEQLCIKTGNRTETSCLCHKGFRLIGTQCLGKFKFFCIKYFFSSRMAVPMTHAKLCFKYFYSSFPIRTFCIQTLMNARRIPAFVDMGNAST